MNTTDELRLRAGLPTEAELARAVEVHRRLRERAEWDGPLPGPRPWRDRLRRLLTRTRAPQELALPR